MKIGVKYLFLKNQFEGNFLEFYPLYDQNDKIIGTQILSEKIKFENADQTKNENSELTVGNYKFY